MSKPFETLTPSELTKLPHCRVSFFGSCNLKEEPPIKQCLKCMLDGLHQALVNRNIATAQTALDSVMAILKKESQI
jgi:hypothetical protein